MVKKYTKFGKYDFKVYKKDAIKNVQIKPNSNVDPKIRVGVLKAYLYRAH